MTDPFIERLDEDDSDRVDEMLGKIGEILAEEPLELVASVTAYLSADVISQAMKAYIEGGADPGQARTAFFSLVDLEFGDIISGN